MQWISLPLLVWVASKGLVVVVVAVAVVVVVVVVAVGGSHASCDDDGE